jgi:hypothetical protein
MAEASREVGRFGYYPLHGAFGTWTVSDPSLAMAWLVTAETPFDLEFMGYEWLRRVVRQNGAEAARILEEMVAGKPDWDGKMHWALADAWGKSDPEAALEWVSTIEREEREERERLLETLVKGIGELQPRVALDAAERMENRAQRIGALWSVVWDWARYRPDDLLTFARGDEQFGGLEPETLRAAGEMLARNRPGEVVALGEFVPEGLRRESFWSGVLRGVTEADPAHFAPAAEAISDEYVEREASGDFSQFVRSWLESDEVAARAWVAALPEGAKQRIATMAVQLGPPLRATGGGR